MSGDSELDKLTAAGTATPPRMLGDTDVSLILSFAEKLPEGAHILEVGPWLGGLTVDLARYGHVTVVDRFIWTDANARNYPGIAEADTSFRSVFEANMAAEGLDVDVIESTLPDLLWEGGPIDFIFIDAPRDAATLHGCLRAVAHAIKPGAHVLIKHALNMRDFGMGAYIDALAGLGLVMIETTEQPDWCNIITFTTCEGFDVLETYEDVLDLIAGAPVASDFTDPWFGHRLSAFRLGYLAVTGHLNTAYAVLAQIPKASENMPLWSGIEHHIRSNHPEVSETDLAVLSELVWVHNDARLDYRLPVIPADGFAPRLAAYWRNNAGQPWVIEALDPWLLGDQQAKQALAAMAEHAEQVFHGRVFEIGSGLGPAALAALTYGAEHYRGIELDKPTDLGAKLGAKAPHIHLGDELDELLSDIRQATVFILPDGVGVNPQVDAALAERLRAGRSEITVIRRPL